MATLATGALCLILGFGLAILFVAYRLRDVHFF